MTSDVKVQNPDTLSQTNTEVDFFQDSTPKSRVRRHLTRAVAFIKKHKLYTAAAASFVLLSVLAVALTVAFYETEGSRKLKAEKIDALLEGHSLYNCYPTEAPVDAPKYAAGRDETAGQFVVRTLKEYGYSANPEAEAKVYIQFNSFMATHQKTYFSAEEKSAKYINFRANLERINAHNSKDSSFKMAINQYSDLSKDELHNEVLGLDFEDSPLAIPENLPSEEFFTPDLTQDLPSDYNWARSNIFAPVMNQGKCRSSSAFAISSAVESVLNLSSPAFRSLSPQEFIDCVPGFTCQSSLSPDKFFDYVATNGLSTLKDYPYLAIQKKCSASQSKFKVHIKGKYYVNKDFDYALVQGTPLVVMVHVDDDFVPYSSGIYEPSYVDAQPNHVMLLVGYGQENDKKYWILKNSWGSNWGEDGYIRILRDELNNDFGCKICSIAMMVYNK